MCSFSLQLVHRANLLTAQVYVASLSNMQGFTVTVVPILVPRVVLIPNHRRVVRQYLCHDDNFGQTFGPKLDRFKKTVSNYRCSV